MRLRIAVLGNSVALVVEPPRKDRSEGTYCEHLVRVLEEAGREAELRNAARWYHRLPGALDDYEEYVRAYSPDVLILQFGVNDMVPRALPVALHRHMFTWREHAQHRRYKRALRRGLWPPLRRYQQLFSRRAGLRTWRVKPARYAEELRYLADMARRDTKCLVLVLDILPPGESVEHWIPGIGRRRQLINKAMVQTIDALDDPQVLYVDTSAAVEHLGREAALPDGLHMSDAAHRAVAEHLSGLILAHLSG